MGLKDLYYSLEEKYYNFLDWLDSKGIPLYKIDDWLHNIGIAGFPVFVLFCLIILALIIWAIIALTGGVGAEKATVYLTFKDITRNMLVSDLQVTLLVGSKPINLTTDGSGRLSFSAEVGDIVSISISDPNYKLMEETFEVNANGQEGIIELEYKGGLLSKTIFFYDGKDSTNQTLYNGKVDAIITCTDNSNYLAEVSTTDGKVTINDLAFDCGKMIVTLQSPTYTSAYFSLDEVSPAVIVKPAEEGFGKFIVTVLDEEGNPKPNAVVKAMSVEYNEVGAQGITQASGVVELDVPANVEYYLIVTDAEGVYATENTNAPIFLENNFTASVDVGQTVSTIVKLTKKNIGSIKLSIKDTAGNPIESATIKIYKNNVEEATGTITTPGVFEWPVGDNLNPYRFVIDSEKYMLEEIDNLYPSESVYSVTLKPIKQSLDLTVLVNGTDDEPVYNATVQLYNEKQNLLVTKSTDVGGGVTFSNLNAGKTYYVRVIKGNFSAESSPITLSGKIENIITVKLNIGNGDLVIKAVGMDNLPVQGAEINIYDIATNAKLNQSPLYTDELGIANYNLRADKVVYIKAVKDNAVFFSLPVQVNVDSTKEITVYMVDKAKNLGLDLIAVYDSQNNLIESTPKPIVAGEEYTAYFLYKVPEGLAYDEMGVFFKAGDNTASSLEKSEMYIKSLEFFNGVTKMGTTYSPPNGTATDLQNLSAKEGIWASSVVNKVMPGNYLVKVVFGTVSAEKGLLSLNYRAWLKKGSTYIREPFDPELGTNASTEKEGMYAKTNQLLFQLGNVVCSGVICSEVVISGEGVKQKVVDSFFAKLNGIYNIDISMKGVSPKEYSNVTLIIESPNKGIELKAKTLETKKTGLTVNLSFNISGSIEARVLKEGTNLIKISLVGNDGTLIYERIINVNVEPSKELFLDLVPSMIVPYVENTLSVRAYDLDVNEGVEGAIINLYIEGKLVDSAKSDMDGYVVFNLPALNVGTKVKIQAIAGGYKTLEKTIEVSENILMTDVPELTITVDRALSDSVEGTVSVTNLTPLKLKIANIYFVNGEFSEYLKLSFKKNYVNVFLSGDTNTLTLEYKAELTKGKNLLEPKEFETTLIVELVATGLNYKWKMTLPVKIYIKLAGGTDTTDCLTIVPLTDTEEELWQILISEGKQKISQQFEIVNNCKVGGKEIYLYNPTIELVWHGKPLGEFLIEGKKLGKKPLKIYSEEGGTISNNLVPGTAELNIDFVSAGDVVSGKSSATIRLRAQNPTSNGLQELKAEAKVQVVVSILEKCLQIISAQGSGMQVNGVPVVILNANNYGMLGITGPGLGYASVMGMNAVGMGPMPGSGVGNVFNNPYFTNVGSGLANRPGMVAYNNWAMNTMNPNMAYQHLGYNPYSGYTGYTGYNLMPGNMGYVNPMMGGMAIPSVAQLQIRNTCEYPVEIELQTMPQLWIDNPTFTLGPGQTQTFRISSTSMVGQYAVYVMAGITRGLLLPISQIPVIVRDLMREVSSDCFVIEGGKVIDFTSVGLTPMYKIVKMWNKCYARGVVMDKAEPVAYQNLLLVDELTGQPKDLEGKPREVFYAKVEKVIKPPQVSTYNGLMAEEFEVMFAKNPEIFKSGTEVPETPNTLSGNIDKLSAIRKLAAETAALVKLPALLILKYSLAYVPQTTSILVYIKDNLNILGGLAKFSQELLKGNPNCGPKDWDAYIHNTIKIRAKIRNDMFKNNTFIYPQSGEIEVMEVSKDCFSSLDRIEYYGPLDFDVYTRDEKAKIHVKVIPGENGQTLKVKFIKPKVLAKGQHDVKVTFQGEVHRNGFKETKVYDFVITAVLEGDPDKTYSSDTLTAEEIIQKAKAEEKEKAEKISEEKEASKECVSLYMDDVVGKYIDNSAYSDIKYTWDKSEIGDKFCDVKEEPYKGQGYFCDQYQFTAELSNKKQAISEFFEGGPSEKEVKVGDVIKKKVNDPQGHHQETGFVKTKNNKLLEYVGYLGGYEDKISTLKKALENMAEAGKNYNLKAAHKAINDMNKCYFTDSNGICSNENQIRDKDRFYVKISGKDICEKAKGGEHVGQNHISLDGNRSCYLKLTDILKAAEWGKKFEAVAKAIGAGQTVMLFHINDPYTTLEVERFAKALEQGDKVGDITIEKLNAVLFKANLMPGKYGDEFYADNFLTGYTIDSKDRIRLKFGEVKNAGTYFIEIQKKVDGNFVFVLKFIEGTEKEEFIYKFPLELPVKQGRTINFDNVLPIGKDLSIEENKKEPVENPDYNVIEDNLDKLIRGIVFEVTAAKKVYNSQGIKYLALYTEDLSKVGDLPESVHNKEIPLYWVPKGALVSEKTKVKAEKASGGFTTVLYNKEDKPWVEASKEIKNILKYKTSSGNYEGSLIKDDNPKYIDVGYKGITNAFENESRQQKKYCIKSDKNSMIIWVNDNWAMQGNVS